MHKSGHIFTAYVLLTHYFTTKANQKFLDMCKMWKQIEPKYMSFGRSLITFCRSINEYHNRHWLISKNVITCIFGNRLYPKMWNNMSIGYLGT